MWCVRPIIRTFIWKACSCKQCLISQNCLLGGWPYNKGRDYIPGWRAPNCQLFTLGTRPTAPQGINIQLRETADGSPNLIIYTCGDGRPGPVVLVICIRDPAILQWSIWDTDRAPNINICHLGNRPAVSPNAINVYWSADRKSLLQIITNLSSITKFSGM